MKKVEVRRENGYRKLEDNSSTMQQKNWYRDMINVSINIEIMQKSGTQILFSNKY